MQSALKISKIKIRQVHIIQCGRKRLRVLGVGNGKLNPLTYTLTASLIKQSSRNVHRNYKLSGYLLRGPPRSSHFHVSTTRCFLRRSKQRQNS
ncbi:Glucose-dependent insulinotropic receptor [Frankliniella fusca]|uniref:Glucose-dependent insulinotropic receptor n=1 Tax=Frankliniella fusca TaxID=407009 RepID=A0AAE1HFX6_9NEOP|nr:Glucose-dependent insulinotropic receptor [Frankliniella fusca]